MKAHTLQTIGLIGLMACSTKKAEIEDSSNPAEETTVTEDSSLAEVDSLKATGAKAKHQEGKAMKRSEVASLDVEMEATEARIGSRADAGEGVRGTLSSKRPLLDSNIISKKSFGSSGHGRADGSVAQSMAPPHQVSRYANDIEDSSVVLRSQNSEEYTDYGINPFVLTTEDSLSTFSIDVDTASYTIARRKLNEGKLPSYAGVRVEEFINYFDYHYDSKEASPFVVELEGMPHPFKEDRHILRVGLQGMEYSKDTRPPLHLTFLVDVSGSMSSADKLPLAKTSMHLLVDTLQEGDSVALATYAGNISKILSPTYGDEKNVIHEAIDRLNSGGSTAMSSGMDLAYEMAWESFEAGAENRVVVLSDGDANVGRTGWEDMISQIKSFADRGVTMSTIGFGMGNYKDTRMEQLANKGDGNNFYIDSRAQAHRVFVEDFNSSMINIARDVKIQMEFNSDLVQSYRLIGYENRDIADKDFRNDRVDAGEVGSGHNVTALYELVLKEDNVKGELATAQLRYEKAGPDSIATERSWTVSAKEIRSQHRASNALKVAFTAATFAEIHRRSPHVSSISLAELISYGEGAQRRGEKDDVELISLMEKAQELGAGPTFVRR